MRLVHLADLHLGFRQYHRLTPSGINQREADVANVFRRAIDRVIALRPDVVLFAGDIFHSVRPMNAAIIHAFGQFNRLRQKLPNSVVVMVTGNHDRPKASETECILRLFRPLGIHVVDNEPTRLAFPEHGLSILAVPDRMDPLPSLVPDPGWRFNILLMHCAVEGVLPPYMVHIDRAPLTISREQLSAKLWTYVALGHYHVHKKVEPNAYYAGSTEYTSSNPWSELLDETESGVSGKGFIEYDLETGSHRFHALESSRQHVDLPSIPARGLSAAELDSAIHQRVLGCDGGIDDKIVRLVVRDVPRHIARDLDHRAVRDYKRRALHFHLDTRRPEILQIAASGAAGRRPTLREMLEGYLSRRLIESDIERAALVETGLRYLDEATAASVATPVSSQ